MPESPLRRFRILPIATVAALLFFGFFAFRNGISFSPTGAATLENTSLIGILLIGDDDDISIPVDHALVRFYSPDTIFFKTSGRTLNVTGKIWVDDFDGSVAWDGEQIIVEGTMKSAHGTGLDVTWTRREHTTITLMNGVADVDRMNLSSLVRSSATGRVTLENRWTAQLNETPFRMNDFDGRLYLQRINNETSLGLEGWADSLKIEEKNLLKKLS